MVHIYDAYYMDSDGNQFIVGTVAERSRDRYTVERYITAATYHATIEAACENVLKRLTMKYVEHNDVELAEAVQAVCRLRKELQRIKAGLGLECTAHSAKRSTASRCKARKGIQA